ncbi:isocitrate lyase/phosphoenolpyruvate mutase family protein [Stenotrophomonas sp. ISL-67]|uniref:isocitrate lyase/PEP mutase family protein n=1 Tax=Stenotrophomonas sp. ISL-67 TaxID=2819171 RepID=UPI001BE76773|nr:isocitrate lyase/phosphoenolpyruvate mutase family protein [Stenotrophomonas sp. ISL-67]MBT2766683.1 isocitrate lyase/phosphoenolpyruvate mutase family protein [Stenotrophomonas sp. ISL-67]
MNAQYPRFSELHRNPSLFILPNVWDAGGAALAQQRGAQAIATTSAAMAWSCGYPDGGALPQAALLQRITEIVRIATVPVTVDIEDGYSDDPQRVAGLVVKLTALGVAGINIEDGAGTPALLVAKLEAIRTALAGTPLFINARTDVYLRGLAQGAEAVHMSVARMQDYARAGAEGAFVPGVSQLDDMAAIAGDIALPLNAMWLPGMAAHSALAQAGVRRLSAGPALSAITWTAMTGAMDAMLNDTLAVPADAPGYAQLNALFAETA